MKIPSIPTCLQFWKKYGFRLRCLHQSKALEFFREKWLKQALLFRAFMERNKLWEEWPKTWQFEFFKKHHNYLLLLSESTRHTNLWEKVLRFLFSKLESIVYNSNATYFCLHVTYQSVTNGTECFLVFRVLSTYCLEDNTQNTTHWAQYIMYKCLIKSKLHIFIRYKCQVPT